MKSNLQLCLMNKILNLEVLTITHNKILNERETVLFLEKIDVTATPVLSFPKNIY